MKYKVVYTDPPFDNINIEKEILDEIDAEVVDARKHKLDPIEVAKDADGLIVTYHKIDEEFINSLSDECKIISRTGIGVDNVDIGVASEKGIYVTNVPDYCIEEVSTHTIALILALERKITKYNESTHSKEWDIQIGRPLHRIRDQNLGVIGLGSIGRTVARKAKGLGFNALGYDPYLERTKIKNMGVDPMEKISDLLKKSDVLSIHVPLTEETRGLISEDEFEYMKGSALIVNTSRGGIIDENALVNALANEKIAGAALDVLESEPPNFKNRIFDEEDLIITPHVSWVSKEAEIELREKAAIQVRQALSGETPNNLINKESLT